jgi:molybdate transport system substrate-binding protein
MTGRRFARPRKPADMAGFRRLAGVLVGLAALVASCGGPGGSGGSSGSGKLVVLAASSLTEAVTEYAESFPGAEVKTSFAGSDTLAAQIRQRGKADVFLSADTEYPRQLRREGLVEKPVVFASNQLVIVVPAGSEIGSLAQLAQPGVKLVIGDESVPVGAYAREVLGRLPSAEREAIFANVAAEEPEVAAVVAKVVEGAADAGLVYRTDAVSAGDAVEAVEIPRALQPDVAYGGAVVSGSGDPQAASQFIAGLIEGEGAADLKRVGFLPPP